MRNLVEYLGMHHPTKDGKWVAFDKHGTRVGTFATKQEAEDAVSGKGSE